MDSLLQNRTFVIILALILAIMLWMIVGLDEQQSPAPITQQEGQRIIDNTPVEAIYDEEMYALMEMDDRVQVFLSGRRSLLNFSLLQTDPYRIFADLTELGEGEHSVPVEHDGFPSELEIEIIPSEIRVVLEEKETVPFEVEVEVTGDVAEGYVIGRAQVTPDEVFVIAPPTILEQIDTVMGSVDVQDANETVQHNMDVVAYDQDGNVVDVEISPDTAEVEIPIRSPESMVPINIHLVGELPQEYSLVSIEQDITETQVIGEAGLAEKEIDVEVDLSEVSSNQTMEIDLPVADDVEIEPSQVVVDIEIGSTGERAFEQLTIDVVGLEADQELIWITPEEARTDIHILGSEARLQSLQAEDIHAFIDVSERDEGEHVIPLQWSIPGYPTYFQTDEGPMNVRVEIVDPNENMDE